MIGAGNDKQVASFIQCVSIDPLNGSPTVQASRHHDPAEA